MDENIPNAIVCLPMEDIGSAVITNGELHRHDGKKFYFGYGTLRDFEKWAAEKIAEATP